jgi:hypothetical protein
LRPYLGVDLRPVLRQDANMFAEPACHGVAEGGDGSGSALNPKIQRDFSARGGSAFGGEVFTPGRRCASWLSRRAYPLQPDFATFSPMNALLQAGLGGRVPAPPEDSSVWLHGIC